MRLDEVKELFNLELAEGKARLEEAGLTVVPSLEVTENEVEGGEREVISVLASLEVSAEGLAPEDLLYICLSEDPNEDGEFDRECCEADIESFRSHVDLVIARAAECEDKAEAVRLVCREIDREIAEKYQAELDKMNAAVKKNLKTAIIATVALLAVAAVCIVIKVVMS